MASYLVTGSSRGLGLELVTQLSQLPASEVGLVFATSRSSSPEITELVERSNGRVSFIELNTTDESSIKRAVEEVSQKLNGKGLDVLINNAGVSIGTAGGIQNMTNLTDHYAVNVLGTHNVTMALLPLLRQGRLKKILNISTTVGSIARAFTNSYPYSSPGYKVTKAALNMLTVQWAQDLSAEGFTVFAISPGWLKSDLGGSIADLEVSVGAKCVVEALLKATTKDNKRFINIHVPGWEHGKPGAKAGEEGPNIYDGIDSPW